MEGYGEESWLDGSKYVGKCVKGMKNGIGIYKW